MKKLTTLFALLLVAHFATAQNPNPSSSLDEFILEEMDTEHSPGMSTLIVKGGEIVWLESYGWADIQNSIPVADSTVFMLASVSKVFTGTALMHLHESGQLDLDADINDYLPFDIHVPNFESESITARMLMTHTASIADNDLVMDTYYSNGDPTIPLADLIQRYFSSSGSDYDPSANFLNSAPGTVHNYSNMGTALAGYVVEAASGMDFSAYCNQHIFNALCMNNSSWYFSDFDSANVARPYQWTGSQYQAYAHYGFADYPDGQLRSNVLDLANFLITYLQEGSFHGYELLSSAAVSEMLSPQVPTIEALQGLNWYLEEIFLSSGGTTSLWGHNGGDKGVSTDIYIDPATEIGIAVLSNGEGDNLYVVDEMYNYALTLSTSGLGNPPCEPAGIPQAETAKGFSIYPNPSNGLFRVKGLAASLGLINVYDALGQLIHSQHTEAPETDMLLHGKGVYTVVVREKNGMMSASKIVVL